MIYFTRDNNHYAIPDGNQPWLKPNSVTTWVSSEIKLYSWLAKDWLPRRYVHGDCYGTFYEFEVNDCILNRFVSQNIILPWITQQRMITFEPFNTHKAGQTVKLVKHPGHRFYSLYNLLYNLSWQWNQIKITLKICSIMNASFCLICGSSVLIYSLK